LGGDEGGEEVDCHSRRECKVKEVPKVYCPREDKEVPIWWCLGSYIQRKNLCPELLEATVKIAEDYAEVKCKAQRLTKRERK